VHASFLGSYVRVAVSCAASPEPVMVAAGEDEAAGGPDREVALWWEARDGILLDPAGGGEPAA
jgi:hypothetical protein